MLTGLALPAAGALAGCGGLLGDTGTPTSTPEPLTELRDRSIYVDSDLSLSIPDVADPVGSPGDADVVVIPADTDRSESAIVHWLARDRYVAFVGEGAEATWHDVKTSDAYAAMLGEPRAMVDRCAGSGSGEEGTATDCDPLDLLVIERLEEISATSGYTWNDDEGASQRRIFEAIDETIADDS